MPSETRERRPLSAEPLAQLVHDNLTARFWRLTQIVAWTLTVVACPNVISAQERAEGAVERAALQVFQSYSTCERIKAFPPCFRLLSDGVRKQWAHQGVNTESGYQDVKGGEEVRLTSHRVLRIERFGKSVRITAHATEDGERGRVVVERTYSLVLQAGEWKIDGIKEGTHEYLP